MRASDIIIVAEGRELWRIKMKTVECGARG